MSLSDCFHKTRFVYLKALTVCSIGRSFWHDEHLYLLWYSCRWTHQSSTCSFSSYFNFIVVSRYYYNYWITWNRLKKIALFDFLFCYSSHWGRLREERYSNWGWFLLLPHLVIFTSVFSFFCSRTVTNDYFYYWYMCSLFSLKLK